MGHEKLREYAELCAVSSFMFLRGASHPEELVARAGELGIRAAVRTMGREPGAGFTPDAFSVFRLRLALAAAAQDVSAATH